MVDTKKYPARYGRDSGPSLTLGDVVRAVAPLIEADDRVGYADKIDEVFLGGCWGHVFDMLKGKCDLHSFEKDLRGLVWDAYRAGRRRGPYADLDEPTALQDAYDDSEASTVGFYGAMPVPTPPMEPQFDPSVKAPVIRQGDDVGSGPLTIAEHARTILHFSNGGDITLMPGKGAPGHRDGVVRIQRPDGRDLVIIYPDGVVEFGPGYEPDETARAFWQVLGELRP